MLATLVHRGPDEGSVDAFGACVLGHRRLRVVDLQTGRQPVADESGAVVAVLNGELYNFRELRAELGARGHEVRGTGDTPVLPHLYEEHGPRFVEHLSGMFALALWDGTRQRLVLARDRLGKKPLLWTRLADGTLAFASELKALLQLPRVGRDVDLVALDAFLALQYVPGPGTALHGIERLPPGHILVAESGRVRVERYWEPQARPEQLPRAEWLGRVREEVITAVRRRLVADVPLGALLSGGIDSGVVVAAMAQSSAAPVRTFTAGFAQARYDEREYARAVAERYGTVHEELVVEPRPAELLPRLAWAFDEPFGDASALPTLLVCEHAARHVTVALTGDGGDEAFGGYERYVAHGLAERVGVLPPSLLRAAAGALRSLPQARSEPRSPFFRAARFLETAGGPPGERYGRLMEIFPPALRDTLWTDEARAAIGRVRSAGELLGPPPAPGVTGLQLLDLRTYLPGDLLVKSDIASMANSLELRSPFLDHRVLELGLSLPPELKARGRVGKVALREAFAPDLPAAVTGRAKRGFGVPLGRWFRDELRELSRDVLLDRRARERGQLRPAAIERLLGEHASGRADHGHRLWCLVMLELWQRSYVDSAGPGQTVAPALAGV